MVSTIAYCVLGVVAVYENANYSKITEQTCLVVIDASNVSPTATSGYSVLRFPTEIEALKKRVR